MGNCAYGGRLEVLTKESRESEVKGAQESGSCSAQPIIDSDKNFRKGSYRSIKLLFLKTAKMLCHLKENPGSLYSVNKVL